MGAQSSGFIGRARPQLPARYEGKLDRMKYKCLKLKMKMLDSYELCGDCAWIQC